MASEPIAVTTAFDVPEISREELRRRLHDPSLTILDVLPADSYASGHIPGALNLSPADLPERAREILPDPNAEVAVYCFSLTCDASERAVRMLRELGYTNARDYRAGLADWVESGGPLQSAPAEAIEADSAPAAGPPLTVVPGRVAGEGPARLSQKRSWGNALLDLIERHATSELFMVWIAMVLLSGAVYWLGALMGEHGLVEAGRPVGAGLMGLATALYFSFVTATSVGYGDVLPVGVGRAMAVAEAVMGLLIFGAVVAKFVSRRQEELVREIHRVTFEERLDRVQTNLHMLLSELLSIASLCETPSVPLARVGARLESALLVFVGELRATHDLLYKPQLVVEEAVLAAILANLASALSALSELLQCLPSGFQRSQTFELALKNLTGLAEDICGECVPHDYTPRLVFWMDRIQATARKIR